MPEFKERQKRVVDNAQAMAQVLLDGGLRLTTGGTDNHLMLVDLTNFGLTGKAVEKWLDAAHITANKNTIPNDPQKPSITSGIRVGTPAVTTRGFKEEEMKIVGKLICQASRPDFEQHVDELRVQVKELTSRFPLYQL